MPPKTINDNGVQSFNLTGNDLVNSVLLTGKYQKNWSLLDENRITYSFLNNQSDTLYPQQYDDNLKEDVSPVSPAVETSVDDILRRVFGSVIAITFDKKTEIVETSTAGIQETTDFGTLRVMDRAFNDTGILGYGIFPNRYGDTDSTNGDLHLSNTRAYTVGSIGYSTILHELGHTLGLKHPFDTSGKTLPLGQDNNTYTVMTYNEIPPPKPAQYTGAIAVSLMPYDIQALQHLYGARATNNDNTTYSFRDIDHYSVNGIDYYTFASGHSKSTLWDSGGQDTLDFSTITAFPTSLGKDGFDYRFDLKQGGFLTEYSSYNSATYNAYDPTFINSDRTRGAWNAGRFNTLSYGTVLAFSPVDNSFDATIENLSGTQLNDYIIGNDVANLIRANSGDDWLDGGGGDDTLDGGLGKDIMLGGQGNDSYYVDNINDVVTEFANQGTDTVNASINYALGANLENLNLLEGTAALNGTGNELNNIITGNSANNILSGGDGNDTLYGGLGRDTVLGGNGNDWIVGGNGNDILTGGSGNDMFVYNSITDAGDIIMDFTVGSDKIVLTDVVNSSGWHSSNLFADGFLSTRQASAGLAALLIDPDGAAGSAYRPAPFILFSNVSAAALSLNNFVV